MFKDPDIEKPAQQLRQERQKRLNDAADLKVPDRVPITCPIGYFAAKYAGIPNSAAFYDFDTWYDANEKTLKDFRPDTFGALGFKPGKAMEILNPKAHRWPGYNCPANVGHQWVEYEGIKANEYDIYMHDVTDYLIRYQLPFLSDKLKGLAKLPQLSSVGHGPVPEQIMAEAVADPEIDEALTTLLESGREMRKWYPQQEIFQKLIESYGYFNTITAAALPPYDTISHSLRGMEGTMFDMFRQPDKLIETCEYILKNVLDTIQLNPDENGRIGLFMTNTRGSDDFISKKQFDRFYWPTFKKLVVELCNRGATPHIFFEGNFDSRIEYLLEFPKGKFVAKFDTSDIFRAKEILKDHCCIEGNIPSSILQVGTKDDVIAYCKKLIDVCGKDGGYIFSPRSSVEEVKPENLKAMIDFVKEYGVYN